MGVLTLFSLENRATFTSFAVGCIKVAHTCILCSACCRLSPVKHWEQYYRRLCAVSESVQQHVAYNLVTTAVCMFCGDLLGVHAICTPLI